MKKLLYISIIVLLSACSGNNKNIETNTRDNKPVDSTYTSIEEKLALPRLSKTTYEILGTDHNNSVENYYILIKGIAIQEDSLQNFVDKFKSEFCNKKCNINLLDNRKAYPAITKYPLDGQEYLMVADHFVAQCSFDTHDIWMYPYQDIKYKELGGKKWKKKKE